MISTHTRMAVGLACAVTVVVGTGAVHAQLAGGPYVIQTLDINGGGTTSTGGPYSISASTGQAGGVGTITAEPVPAPPLYQFDDGFWSTITAPDGCECVASTAPGADRILNAAGVSVDSVKNRFLSFSGGDGGPCQAVRVGFVNLPGDFSILNGTIAWVAQPNSASELPGKALTDPVGTDTPFMAARLSSSPVYADWATFGVVHVFDERIIPSRKRPGLPLEPAVYDIQLVSLDCDVNNEASYSPALTITNARWGDVASLANGQFRAPDGSIDVTADVLAVLAKFSNAPGAPIKARADMVGTGAGGPQAAITGKIDISDVLAGLGAFSGGSYPFSPP